MHDVSMLDFGHAIRRLRTARKISLNDAATYAGVHRTTLQRWEKNETEPRITELEALLEVLQTDAAQRQQLLARLNAPRARVRGQTEIVRIAEKHDLGTIPNGGNLLRAMRMRRGLSIEEVAARMQVSTRTLRRWERAESWPPVETLHRLCQILQAHEEEIIALIGGGFAPPLSGRDDKADEVVENVERYWNSSHMHSELEFLNLIARTWPRAVQNASLRPYLARCYLMYADHLSLLERWQEVSHYTGEALRLRSPENACDDCWVMGAIAEAHSAVHGGIALNPNRGLAVLRPWLSLASIPIQQAWIEARLAEYLLMSGANESALLQGAHACKTARNSGLPLEMQRRNKDQGVLLMKAGLPSAALPLFQSASDGNSILGLDMQVWQVKALLELEERAEAHSLLQKIQETITTGQLHGLQAQVDILTVRL